MDPLTVVPKLVPAVLGGARKLWRALRFGARAEIELGWRSPLAWFIDDPVRYTRSISVTITAPKHEELVVASGLIEVRESGARPWRHLADVGELILLPLEIPANRATTERLCGPSLATALTAKGMTPDAPVQIRVRFAGRHRERVATAPLDVTAAELRREDIR